MSDQLKVTLGKHELPVYPQPPQRIIKRLGRLRDAFSGAIDERGFDAEVLMGGLGKRVYYLFETFVPNLPERMPEWEFWGYSSRDAFDADDFDEDRDGGAAATFPQWLDAFDIVVEANGGKRFLEGLGKVLELKMLKAELTLMVSDALAEIRERDPNGSPSSPSTNGESPPTSSGTSDPTSDASDTSESDETAEKPGTPQPALA